MKPRLFRLGGLEVRAGVPRWLMAWVRRSLVWELQAQGQSQTGPTNEWNPTGDRANVELYSTLASVYAAVYARANALAQVPWRVKRLTRGGTEEDLSKTDHPLQRLLSIRPNAWDTAYETREATFSFLDLVGSAYWLLEGGAAERGGEPEEIFALKAHNVTPVADKVEKIRAYQYLSETGARQDIPAIQVVQFNTFSPLKHYVGQASVDAGRLAALCDLYAITVNKQFFERGALPSGILSDPTNTLTDAELDRHVQAFNLKYAGASNAGTARGVAGGLKWEALTPAFKDMMFPELRKVNFEEIIRALHTPPVMVGSMDGASYANAREQTRNFWTLSGLPMLRRMEERVNHSLAWRFGAEIRADVDLTAIEALRRDLKAIAEVANAMFDRRALSPNEYRIWIQTGEMPDTLVDPVEGGDETYGSVAQVPTSELLIPPEPAPAGDGNAPAAEPPADPSQQGFVQSLERFESLARERLQYPSAPRVLGLLSRALREQRRSGERVMDRSARTMFREQEKRVLARLEDLIPGAPKRWTRRTRQTFRTKTASQIGGILEELVARHAALFRASHESVLDAVGKDVLRSLDLPIEFTLNTPGSITYLQQAGARLVKGANEQTVEALAATLAEGTAAGENVSALGDRVRAVFAEASRGRATRIAVTETTKSLGFGSLEAYRQTDGVVKRKEWQTAGDSEVRGNGPNDEFDHVSAHGQQREINDPYEVSGEPLMYPGDGAGSAGNTINCRCDNLPVLDQAAMHRLITRLMATHQNGNGVPHA